VGKKWWKNLKNMGKTGKSVGLKAWENLEKNIYRKIGKKHGKNVGKTWGKNMENLGNN